MLGILIALGYNLEWPSFHADLQFGLFWGVFPFLVGYLAMDGDSVLLGIFGAAFCFLASLVQRALSFRARYLRRKLARVSLSLWERTGSGGATSYLPQDPVSWLLRPLDRALILLSFAVPTLWQALLLARRLRRWPDPVARAYLESDLAFLRELFGHFDFIPHVWLALDQFLVAAEEDLADG